MSDKISLPKANAILNIFALIGTFLLIISTAPLYIFWGIYWAASNTTGRAGLVFSTLMIGNQFFNIWAKIEGRLDLFQDFFAFLYPTVFASIWTAGHITGAPTNNWMFRMMWAGWACQILAALGSIVVNLKFQKDKKSCKTYSPAIADFLKK